MQGRSYSAYSLTRTDVLSSTPIGLQTRDRHYSKILLANSDLHVAQAPKPTPFLATKAFLVSLKRLITRICIINATLNLAATFLSFLVAHGAISEESRENVQILSYKTVICAVSFCQVLFVISYWRLTTHYWTVIHKVLKDSLSTSYRSRSIILPCLLEGAFHLVLPWPGFDRMIQCDIFGRAVLLSTSDLLFFAILARNYHSWRAVYWSGAFAEIRTQWNLSVMGVKSNFSLWLRTSFAQRARLSIWVGYFLSILFAGLGHFALEHEIRAQVTKMPWDDLWRVAVTQATIGYGDVVPSSPLSQAAIILSITVNICMLGLVDAVVNRRYLLKSNEMELYFHVADLQLKAEYRSEAAELIQTWWRLIWSRRKKKPDGRAVLALYCQLAAYRGILLRGRGLSYTQIRRQVTAFQSLCERRFSRAKKQLSSIPSSLKLVKSTQAIRFSRCEFNLSARFKELLDSVHSLHPADLQPEGEFDELGSSPNTLPTQMPAFSQRLNSRVCLRQASRSAFRNVMKKSFRTSEVKTPGDSYESGFLTQ